MGIPISLRSGFAISTENGKAANEMTEGEWEEFLMLCLNISGAIIGACFAPALGPIKAAQNRRGTKPLPYVDALSARAACWFLKRLARSRMLPSVRPLMRR